MSTEMATVVRQVKRFQPSDWFTDAYTQATSADKQREAAFEVSIARDILYLFESTVYPFQPNLVSQVGCAQ